MKIIEQAEVSYRVCDVCRRTLGPPYYGWTVAVGNREFGSVSAEVCDWECGHLWLRHVARL